MPIFGWLPGADTNSIAEREVADLNATRTGSADRTGAWNWQDDFGAWMAGTNKDEVLRLAQKKADRRLTEKLAPGAKAAAASLGPLNAEYKGVTGLTAEEAEAQILLDTKRAGALETAQTNSPTFDPTKLAPSAGAGAILQAGSAAVVEDQRTERDDERTKNETRQDNLTTAANKRADDLLERENLRQDRRDARADLDRAENRRLTAETNQMQIGLQYAQLAQSENNRRRDRKDKAIMTLISGLGNLGAAFTI
jgi:hypothetical protein